MKEYTIKLSDEDLVILDILVGYGIQAGKETIVQISQKGEKKTLKDKKGRPLYIGKETFRLEEKIKDQIEESVKQDKKSDK